MNEKKQMREENRRKKLEKQTNFVQHKQKIEKNKKKKIGLKMKLIKEKIGDAFDELEFEKRKKQRKEIEEEIKDKKKEIEEKEKEIDINKLESNEQVRRKMSSEEICKKKDNVHNNFLLKPRVKRRDPHHRDVYLGQLSRGGYMEGGPHSGWGGETTWSNFISK